MSHQIYTEILFIYLPIFKNNIFELVYYAWHLYKMALRLRKEDNYMGKPHTEVNYCNSSLYLTVSFPIVKAKLEI